MLSAVLHIAETIAAPIPRLEPRPYLYLPFKRKSTLFRYLRGLYDEHLQDGRQLLPSPPKYSTLVAVAKSPEFTQKIRFLRVVWHGKCPDCVWYKFQLRKALSPKMRSDLEREYMSHLRLDASCKNTYYAMRLRCVLSEGPVPELFIIADGPERRTS